MRWAVVLAGGVGSRFWPLSTAQHPKQLLPLAGTRPLVVDSVARLLGVVSAERVLLVTSRALQAALRDALPEVPRANVLAEPFAASTAPALAWATTRARASDAAATVLSVHADWTVGNPEAFRSAAAAALDLAEREGAVVTVGARATRPEIGYGYIVPGAPIGRGPARRIARFVEKPSAAEAERLIASGALWNTGMFAWTAARFREEIERHTPELAPALPALDRGDVDGFYGAAKPVSVDVGLFERTASGAVLAGDFGWDDVGSWAALPRVRAGDAAGNVAVGAVHAVDAAGCVVWSEEGPTVLDGVADLVVVRARGIVLVTTRERAPHLKELLARLPPELAGDGAAGAEGR
ncbi:MAG TPA: sugar phosphate nucleotidyltransferase [Gemmatimonadales bacterium]|nr:sugar phosphate nucleotidyltransferase [Gemmatimonadales bacterium]